MLQIVRTLPLSLSTAQISPPYGIIAPKHDFTQYNRDRASSVATVSLDDNIIIVVANL